MVRTGMTGMVGTRIGGMFIQEYAQRKFMLSYTHAEQLVDTLIQQGFCEEKFTPEYGYRIYHA